MPLPPSAIAALRDHGHVEHVADCGKCQALEFAGQRLSAAGNALPLSPARLQATAARRHPSLNLLPDCKEMGKPLPAQGCGCGEKVRACAIKGKCRAEVELFDDATCCLTCDQHTEAIRPRSVVKIETTKLLRSDDNSYTNCSIHDFDGRLFLAHRRNWRHARIDLAELGPDLQPLWSIPLETPHPTAVIGSEDPRLFTFRDQLCVSFNGFRVIPQAGSKRGKWLTTMLLAPLTRDFRVELVSQPSYAPARAMEKNWVFFEHGGELYCVYEIRPHRVLRLTLGVAQLAHETSWSPAWPGGDLRGGCPPVLVGDEYYHFFHGRLARGRDVVYSMGLYTFEARPPFAPKRYTPWPIQFANPFRRPLKSKDDLPWSVIYPAGAVLRGNQWLISQGHQDQEMQISTFDAADIEQALQPVK